MGGPVRPALTVLGTLKPGYDDDALRALPASHLEMVEAMAVQIFHKAAAALEQPPDPTVMVNPYAVSLDPDAWVRDGLFDGPGLTLADAEQRAPGVGFLWLDRPPGPPGGPPAPVGPPVGSPSR